jgi:hypothetical protein
MPPASEDFAAQSRTDSAKITGSPRFKAGAEAAVILTKKCRMVVLLPAGNRSGAYRTRKFLEAIGSVQPDHQWMVLSLDARRKEMARIRRLVDKWLQDGR